MSATATSAGDAATNSDGRKTPTADDGDKGTGGTPLLSSITYACVHRACLNAHVRRATPEAVGDAAGSGRSVHYMASSAHTPTWRRFRFQDTPQAPLCNSRYPCNPFCACADIRMSVRCCINWRAPWAISEVVVVLIVKAGADLTWPPGGGWVASLLYGTREDMVSIAEVEGSIQEKSDTEYTRHDVEGVNLVHFLMGMKVHFLWKCIRATFKLQISKLQTASFMHINCKNYTFEI